MLTPNKSNAFFVNGADDLSAFFVHDKPNDGTGGSTGMTFDLVNDTAKLLVRDDPGDTYPAVGMTHFESNHNWINCCTDGLAIGALDNIWDLLAEFNSRT